MRHRTVWLTGLVLCVPAWVLVPSGSPRVAIAMLAASTLAFGLALEWRGAEGRSRALAAELEAEREKASAAWTQAWQNALLAHASEELRTASDPHALWSKAAEAVGRVLDAARVVVYSLDAHGTYRVWAQFAAEGVTPLRASASLPAALVNDRDLAAKLASDELESTEDPELRVLAGRLRGVIVVPVGETLALAALPADAAGRFTAGERRFVQRFCEHVARIVEDASTQRLRGLALERADALLGLARALASAREVEAIIDIAVGVGGPLAGATRCAVLLESAHQGFVVAAKHGFVEGPSSSALQRLFPRLEDAVRRRSLVVAETVESPLADAVGPLLIAPLFYGRELLGVLLLEAGAADETWDSGRREVVRRTAELTAAALKTALLLGAHRRAEERHGRLFDESPDLFLRMRHQGRIAEARGRLARALGASASELVGASVERLVATDSLYRWRKLERDVLLGESVRDVFLRLRGTDGGEIDVLASAFLERCEDGDEGRMAQVVFRDVTDIARLEEQLRQSQKLEIAGSLAGGMAHDLNNVLGAILGYASLLRTHLDDRPEASNYVETIERSAVRGAELTGRLLAASRKRPARREAVSLNLVVEETLALLAHTIDRRIRIDKSLDRGVHAMIADPSQLQQIVLNLCVNARDAMPEGGLMRVSTRVEPGGERVRLSVEDTGTGMDSTTIERLFEPFFSTKGEAGTGLGLSVVYGVVKALGGDIRVQSSPGHGARFDVFLPCQWAEEKVPERSPELGSRGEGELILLVDDEKVLRELGKEILEANGYRVETVATGEEALEFVRRSTERVSLVILDLVMPGIDGGETLKRLRRHDASIPILLSSGLAGEDGVQELLMEAATAFIGKPYGMGELTRAVGSALKSDQLLH